MKNCSKVRLCINPSQKLSKAEHQYWNNLLPQIDLPDLLTVPTKNGGSLKFSLKDSAITLVSKGASPYAFAMRFGIDPFLSFLSKGGCLPLPAIGNLTATPLGLGWSQLSLNCEQDKSKHWDDPSFVANVPIGGLAGRL